MAATPAQPSSSHSDPVVDRYIAEFRRRHRQTEQTRNLELRQIGLDVFTRSYHEYFALPSKTAFEVSLQVILEPDERDRLQIDPQFTQAWQIFLDLCWMRWEPPLKTVVRVRKPAGLDFLPILEKRPPHLCRQIRVSFGMFRRKSRKLPQHVTAH